MKQTIQLMNIPRLHSSQLKEHLEKIMEKFIAFLAGLPITILGGICLSISLYLEFSGVKWALDPAWVTIIVSGLPLLYLSII